MKYDLGNTFSIIKPDQSVETIDVSPTMYQQLDENFNQFKGHQLVSLYEFNDDWSSWEVHPKGDEIVVLLSGEITFVLDIDGEHKRCRPRIKAGNDENRTDSFGKSGKNERKCRTNSNGISKLEVALKNLHQFSPAMAVQHKTGPKDTEQ